MPKGHYKRPSVLDRLHKWSIEEPNTGCRIWMGTRTKGGYGQIGVWDPIGRRQISTHAHRVMYEETYGPLPPGMLACHTCDNPPCVNAKHLFAGTYQDNVDDMFRKGRARRAKGEDHGLAVYTPELIFAVRSALNRGIYQHVIAEQFGISQSHVSRIKHGQTWRHLLDG